MAPSPARPLQQRDSRTARVATRLASQSAARSIPDSTPETLGDLGYAPVDPEVAAVARAAAARFEELGCVVEQADPGWEDPAPWFEVLCMRMMAVGLRPQLARWREQMDPQLVAAIGRAEGITAEDLTAAAAERLELQARARAFFGSYDMLLTPTMSVPPFEVGLHSPSEVAGRPVEGMQWTPFTYPFNASGHPAASVPAGSTADGLPVGLQIVGGFRRDDLVLRACQAFVPLVGDDGATLCSLKLECLQDTGSFKMRGAGNATQAVAEAGGERGVYTLSAGNMGAALARAAQLVGVSAAAVVPDNAPAAKRATIERWGAELTAVRYDDWWRAVIDGGWEPLSERSFVHPFADERVMAGNATIALELVEQLPELEQVVCAYGGGGLICGIAAALKALRPEVRIVVAEVETAAPLTAAFAAGRPTPVDYRASFVDGCGSRSVAEEMWPLARELIDDTVVVGLDEVAAAVSLLAERCHVVAEGAGAVPVAAALASARHGERSVCIVSGGNIDPGKLTTILGGGVP